MATLEDATKLGLAVQASLARPPLDPLLDPGTPAAVLRQRLTAQLHYLQTLHVLSADGLKPLLAYVEDGTLPESPAGPALLNTEVLLTTVVLFLHDVGPGSLFGDMPLALAYVVDAAVDGALHAGPDGAVTCAAIATTQVLQGLKSVSADISEAAVNGLKSAFSAAHGLGADGLKPHCLKPHGLKPHGLKPHGLKP
jgi:hypothetical protein